MTTNPLMARFEGAALIEPQQQAKFEACLGAVIGHPRAAEMLSEVDSDEQFWPEPDSWQAKFRPYNVVGGILQIPVKGVLLHNFAYALFDWATGYDYIWQAFKRGCADYSIGQIKGIAFIVDSPGGMVAGCFDAVDRMVALKEDTGVPVRAFAHESAYSAAYAIATVADHIAVSRTGGVGSVGVVTGHMDVSGAMEKAGLKFTYIASDPSKVEGNPYEALSPGAKARIQARIDELYGIFVAAVARSRGLEESVIRNDLKAYTYTATQAVSNGLADSIGSLEDATSAFAEFLDDQSDNEGEEKMAESATSTVDQAVHEKAVADAEAKGFAAGKEAGLKEGAAATQTRIGDILGCDEAKGRRPLAEHFAFKTDLSVDAVKAALSASAAEPEQKTDAAEAQGGFDAAMEQDKPGVGASARRTTEDADDASDIVALANAWGLPGFKATSKE